MCRHWIAVMLRLPFAAVVVSALFAAGPAAAWEAHDTRLSLGLDPALASPSLASSSLPSLSLDPSGTVRLNLGVAGSLAAGPAITPVPDGFHLIPGGHGRMALGGFFEVELGAVRFGGVVGGADDGGRAVVSAAYAFGDTSLVMALGGTWSDPTATVDDDFGYQDGLDFRLSLRHALTPQVYVAGTAAAATEPRSTTDRSSMMFGASIGLRF